jgi:CRP/FNR family transcriptional regulator, cyclic AMP receptor protein
MVSINLFRNEDQLESFVKDQSVFKEGERGRLMYVVLEGSVTLTVNSKVVETVGPGGVLGEMAMIDDSPRSATAIAETDSKLAVIDAKRFNFLIQQTPNFSLQIMRVIADRLRRMDSKLV